MLELSRILFVVSNIINQHETADTYCFGDGCHHRYHSNNRLIPKVFKSGWWCTTADPSSDITWSDYTTISIATSAVNTAARVNYTIAITTACIYSDARSYSDTNASTRSETNASADTNTSTNTCSYSDARADTNSIANAIADLNCSTAV